VIEVPDANQERRLRPGWWARLEGESFDLVALHEALGDSGGVLVRRYDGRYYLRMAEFDEIAQSDAIETRAAKVLRVANGAARVQHANHREVRVDAVASVQPDGEIRNFIHKHGSVHARARVSASVTVNGEERPVVRTPSITKQAIEAALHDAAAERALRIFGRNDADFRDLYHVLEIAEAADGDGIYSDDTVTRAEVRRFKHTANSVHALGDQARHGHETTQPPPQPTSIGEAQALVGRVLRAWLARDA
jgi:hypothetical protein